MDFTDLLSVVPADEVFTIVELGVSVYKLQHDPNPLELMRLLGTVDREYLSEKAERTEEEYAADLITDLFSL